MPKKVLAWEGRKRRMAALRGTAAVPRALTAVEKRKRKRAAVEAHMSRYRKPGSKTVAPVPTKGGAKEAPWLIRGTPLEELHGALDPNRNKKD